MKYIVDIDHEQVATLLDGLRDGAGDTHYIPLPGCEVMIDTEAGTYRFSYLTFIQGPISTTGSLTYKCWGFVIRFVMKQASTLQERNAIAEAFIALGQENHAADLQNEEWVRAFATL